MSILSVGQGLAGLALVCSIGAPLVDADSWIARIAVGSLFFAAYVAAGYLLTGIRWAEVTAAFGLRRSVR